MFNNVIIISLEINKTIQFSLLNEEEFIPLHSVILVEFVMLCLVL